MYLLIIILPLIGTVTSLLFGRLLGTGAPLITIMNMSISLLLSTVLAYEVIFQYSPVVLHIYNYIDFELIDANIEFVFDQLSVSMLFIIILISLLVHIYSLEYMSSDPNLPRFMGYLSLFTFMMILMVTSNNYLQLFFGWEGVGLASYLLINFWFSRIAANKAAFKAVVYNRFGDLALILALLLIFKVFKSFEFEIINAGLPLDGDGANNFNLFLIGLFLIIAALAKSAQIGLHAWLPDAMEGPTPVSALLHAATMVTAGVYLLIRSQSFFILIPNLLIALTFIGSLTAFFAASTGLTQNDLKKIIAYSTCSQLGYMFLACGNGQFSISFFHLINHAFFVRQHRYLNLFAFLASRLIKYATNSYTLTWWELNDGPSLRNLLKRNKSTYLFFKFKYNLKWERLMKMNSCKNCIFMIVSFALFYSFEKFIPEIINDGPQITSRCRIEKISPPFLGSKKLPLKIIQMLKVGKHNLFNSFTPLVYFIRGTGSKYLVFINHFNSFILLSRSSLIIIWLLFYNFYLTFGDHVYFMTAGLINSKYITALNAGLCNIKLYSTTPIARSFLDYHNNKKSFRRECKDIFKLHKSYNQIKYELNTLTSRYAGVLLLGSSYKSLSFLKNYIHKRIWLWARKKHKKVGKTILFKFYFKDNKFNVSLPSFKKALPFKSFINTSAAHLKSSGSLNPLPSVYSFNNLKDLAPSECQNGIFNCLHNNFFNNNVFNDSQVEHKFSDNRLSTLTLGLDDIFNLVEPQDLQFINVEKEYQNIIFQLDSLSSGGIYLFWLLDDPTKLYVGSTLNLKKRFYAHHNNSLITNTHPKFYNCVKKYGWSKFGFKVVELIEDKSLLIEKENILLNKLFNNPSLMYNTLNILKFGNNWLNNKHSDKTKKLISDKLKGTKKSELHKLKISKGLTNKKKSNETKLKISLALKNNPNLKNPDKKYKPLVMTDKDNNIIKTFKGVLITQKELKLSQKKLKDIIENKELYLSKYYIKFK